MSKKQFLEENMKAGETYAGLLLGHNGEPDYHLFILPGEAEKVTWEQATEWAKKAGGALPNRRDHRVLFANAKDQFKAEWYWSSELIGSDYAWCQHFLDGCQYNGHKGYELRARAVRRLPI